MQVMDRSQYGARLLLQCKPLECPFGEAPTRAALRGSRRFRLAFLAGVDCVRRGAPGLVLDKSVRSSRSLSAEASVPVDESAPVGSLHVSSTRSLSAEPSVPEGVSALASSTCSLSAEQSVPVRVSALVSSTRSLSAEASEPVGVSAPEGSTHVSSTRSLAAEQSVPEVVSALVCSARSLCAEASVPVGESALIFNTEPELCQLACASARHYTLVTCSSRRMSPLAAGVFPGSGEEPYSQSDPDNSESGEELLSQGVTPENALGRLGRLALFGHSRLLTGLGRLALHLRFRRERQSKLRPRLCSHGY